MSKPVIANAWVGMLPSMDGFEKGLSTGIGAAAGSAGIAGGTAYGGAFLGAAKKFFLPLLAVLGAGALAEGVAGFAQVAIDQASTLGESVNAVNVVFGEASDSVLALGEDSANAIGLSRAELNAYTVQFAGFAKTVAGEGGDVAGTLGDLTTRGADFASVMDLDVSEALLLFQSGLAGETEPLRRYSVFLDAATVSAYAAANGIGEAGRELTEQEKVLARYGSLMEQTSVVQGDFARTSGDLANAQRRLDAQWTNVQATLGEALIPLAEMFVGIMADSMPVVEQLAGLFADLFGALFEGEDAGVAFQEFLTALQPALDDLALVFDAELVPVIREMAATFAKDLLPMLVQAAPELAKLVALGLEMFVIWSKTMLPALILVGQFIGGALIADFTRFSNIVGWVSDQARAFARNTVQEWRVVQDWFTGLPDRLRSALSSVAATISAPFKQAFNNIASLWNKGVGSLGFKFPSWVPGYGGKGFEVPNIPLLANGGIVTRPTLAMIGEGGQSEAVIPLDRADEFGFGGGGAGGVTELGPYTMGRLVEALEERIRLYADGREIAATATGGQRLTNALGGALA